MKSLQEYIYEELDIDNILWLIDTWFNNKESEATEFIDIITRYNTENKKTINDIKQILSGTLLEKNLREFVNFVYNDVKNIDNKDYIYCFKKIIDIVSGNKSFDNKYIKRT